jgi:hypothetical protein
MLSIGVTNRARRLPAHAVILGSESSVFRPRFEPILNAEVSAEIGGVPPVSQALRLPSDGSISVRTGLPMNTHSPDFVTVDMRGLKAALVARALAQRVSVSVLVRAAVETMAAELAVSAAFGLALSGTSEGQQVVEHLQSMSGAFSSVKQAAAEAAGLAREVQSAGGQKEYYRLKSGGS